MQWTGLNDLREKFLSFFESKEHLRLPSFSLVPQNDKSLLLINSGMAPMKKYFTGEITPPQKRVTTCQKCIRTPDIERVGKTARHGTYFEMLGNFSFGDYFKVQATAWAWEFCTKVLELPVDKLWVTIYLEDDEAFDIWTQQVGVAPDRIVRMGKEDNFWEHGIGPCGPCSEIYFDRGPEHSCGDPDCKLGCECDRYVEFWNLVFTQFDSDGKGNYSPLEHPNIDTGMGLERLACIMQGVDNLFEVDTVQKIMQHIIRIAGIQYHDNANADVSLRVITDHIRSTTFMIGDGVMPSNEGRGYVLRRLLRRAARHGRLLGIERPFLAEVCETVIEENRSAYPNLVEKRDFIHKLIQIEEENFAKTIDTGLAMLHSLIERVEGKVVSGEDAFKLYDTFGFPIDLTREIVEEKGLSVDEETFQRLMKEQKERARKARKAADGEAWAGSKSLLAQMDATRFAGYEQLSVDGVKILAILRDGELADSLQQGEEGIVVTDVTPFYAEGGGQVGDKGRISEEGGVFDVVNTTKSPEGVYLHHGKMEQGSLQTGDLCTAGVDVPLRLATMRNHTAAHLLQAALRKVLGNHVEQAGQMVDGKNVRFDFTHFSPMTSEEIVAVEQEVNSQILLGAIVSCKEMSMEEAKQLGAMALFGEKYGNVVRVVQAGDYSAELCGGTHIDNTAKIGLFKIVSESSVAAGVRRIEGVTGEGVLALIQHVLQNLHNAADALKLNNSEELVRRAGQLLSENKEKDREIEHLRGKLAASELDSLFQNAVEVEGLTVAALQTSADAGEMRTLCDAAKAERANLVLVLASVSEGKVTFCCACGKDAVSKGAHAGNIVREISKIAGGSGGGRPDSAMAGGKDPSKAEEALTAVVPVLEGMIRR